MVQLHHRAHRRGRRAPVGHLQLLRHRGRRGRPEPQPHLLAGHGDPRAQGGRLRAHRGPARGRRLRGRRDFFFFFFFFFAAERLHRELHRPDGRHRGGRRQDGPRHQHLRLQAHRGAGRLQGAQGPCRARLAGRRDVHGRALLRRARRRRHDCRHGQRHRHGDFHQVGYQLLRRRG